MFLLMLSYTNKKYRGGFLMKKYLIVLLAALVMLTGQVALAAAQVDSLQTVEIIADDNVNIFDYSF